MLVEFDTFRFDTDNGVLTRHGKSIYLKPKQHALLALFIDNAGTTLSKERILESVWHDRIVSEQVVFQTISQLRAIIGERAIQTYSRRGYKWNLPIQQITLDSPSIPVLVNQLKTPKRTVMVVVFLLILALSYWLFRSSQLTSTTPIDVLPFNGISELELINRNFEFTTVEQLPPFATDFLTMPVLTWQDFFADNGHWLLGGRVYTLNNGAVLEFRLQRGDQYWHDYVYSLDPAQLGSLLNNKMSELQKLGLFKVNQTSAQWVSLLRTQNAHPLQASIDLYLAKYFDDLGHTDTALAYLNSVLALPTTIETLPIYVKAALQKALIYKHNGQYDSALEMLNNVEANAQLTTQIWPLKFELVKTRAFIAYAMRDSEQVSTQLRLGATLAKQNIDAMGRFQLHILDSILSAKLGLNERKYVQLNEAQELITEQQLHPANLAFVYLHYALFANDNNTVIKYLKKIVELPRTEHNFWVLDDAYERLFDMYIKADMLTQAHSLLVTKKLRTVSHNLLHARLLLAQNQTQQAISILEQSYQQSQREFDKNSSIHAARALYQYLDKHDKKRQFYYDFLQRNGEQKWLEHQQNKQG
ncbi:winged helix-turn-helix domain-containing protein [Pseudoalteromonas sp. T1lg23B]|uniref:winged helix-turn-helix domain-containing protein n=1 Tax=Pseudoalteromonas sp. T1lg23B TaxID=2077097 RepID=UPI000CF6F721|nr:winged helix-turn-helix domain-containing protein [Pseudoalteromonas sp. T1lg23B]